MRIRVDHQVTRCARYESIVDLAACHASPNAARITDRAPRDISLVDLDPSHAAADAGRIQHGDLIRRVDVAVVDSDLLAGARHTNVERQRGSTFGDDETRVAGHTVGRARRTSIPRSAATADVVLRRLNFGAHGRRCYLVWRVVRAACCRNRFAVAASCRTSAWSVARRTLRMSSQPSHTLSPRPFTRR
jgi:hypothetical protein